MNFQKESPYSGALTIAGLDPSGGAGILADCRAFEDFGFRGMAILSAITVQGPSGVLGVFDVPEGTIIESAETIARQTNIKAVKIGMLNKASIVRQVAKACDLFNSTPIVLDTVLAASDQTALLDKPGIKQMILSLFPKVDVITPNAPEAQALTGLKVNDQDSAFKAGRALLEMGAKSVVIKGGHLPGDATDYLISPGVEIAFAVVRVPGVNARGTGCAFSSALAALLGRGFNLDKAITKAKSYMAKILSRG